MARPVRLILPGVAAHIIQRGNNRSACFQQDSDYLTYLGYLRHLSSKYRCEVHAYCLMTNHVHLLVTPSMKGACALLMRDLGRCYVRYFNRRYKRTGTLWEGRFRSCIAESANYVLACYRYIELNPVRARMADHPSGYLWSSYAINAGMRSDPLIRSHVEFSALAADPESAMPPTAPFSIKGSMSGCSNASGTQPTAAIRSRARHSKRGCWRRPVQESSAASPDPRWSSVSLPTLQASGPGGPRHDLTIITTLTPN